jgi:hypothetical protein
MKWSNSATIGIMTVQIRIVMIGTSSSGRRGLINALLGKPYEAQADDDGDYTFDDMHQTLLTVNGAAVDMTVCSPFWPGFGDNPDATQQGFAGLTYAFADGFLVVYSINDVSRFTFEDWIPKHIEFARVSKLQKASDNFGLRIATEYDGEANVAFRRSFPFAVVATKRDTADARTISADEGSQLAESLNAEYYEVSARDDPPKTIVAVFEHLVRKILAHRNAGGGQQQQRRRPCCVLL